MEHNSSKIYFFVNNQQHKMISVNTHVAYLKLLLSQNVEETPKYTD